jgi:hypothetical protein
MTPVMAYLSEPLPGRVFFGPFPTSKDEITHLLDTCGVTHIVNLKPVTSETTKTGLPRDSWYQCFWQREDEKNPLPTPELMRMPLPKKDSKHRDLIAWYAKTAQRVATEAGPSAVYYIHHDTGLQEEALLAFTLCHVLNASAVPDVDAWIASHPGSNGVLLADDDRDMLRECIAKLSAGGAQPMLKWVKVSKRAKVGE